MTHLSFLITAPEAAKPFLPQELAACSVTQLSPHRSGMLFRGDLLAGYRVCMESRLASHVFVQVGEFPAETDTALYDGIFAINWTEHLLPTHTVALSASTSQSTLAHSHFISLRAKDALVDQLRERTGSRPSVDLDDPDLRVHLVVRHNVVTVFVDLGGKSLHQRGYRVGAGEAPLRENVAALLLWRAGWPERCRRGESLIDPMCGSGTIPIEAALMASDIAPGLLSLPATARGWLQHDAELWSKVRAEAEERRRAQEHSASARPVIIGADIDRSVLRLAETNAKRAGVARHIELRHCDLRTLMPPTPSPDSDGESASEAKPGVVVVNPPYGERMGDERSLRTLYAALGGALQDHFVGYTAYMLTGDVTLGKQTGLRASGKWAVNNGALHCVLLELPISEPAAGTDKSTRLRTVTGATVDAGQVQMLVNRLHKNEKRLRKWRETEHIHCYRLYDADLPEYAAAVDVYENVAHVQEYAPPTHIDPDKAAARLETLVHAVGVALAMPAERVHLKVRRRQRGLAQYDKHDARGDLMAVHEGGLRFLVNLSDYLDTGLFLDQRPTRAHLRTLASGGHFLNLFSYTGTATVCAAAGGARSTTSVDLSHTYLAWAERNLAENLFRGDEHALVRADCLAWLRDAAARGDRYDVIYVDPPTFSNSKSTADDFDVQRDHATLLTLAAKILRSSGIMIFSCNFRRFKLAPEALRGLSVQDITARTLPPDFARNPRIHQCFELRHRS